MRKNQYKSSGHKLLLLIYVLIWFFWGSKSICCLVVFWLQFLAVSTPWPWQYGIWLELCNWARFSVLRRGRIEFHQDSLVALQEVIKGASMVPMVRNGSDTANDAMTHKKIKHIPHSKRVQSNHGGLCQAAIFQCVHWFWEVLILVILQRQSCLFRHVSPFSGQRFQGPHLGQPVTRDRKIKSSYATWCESADVNHEKWY